MENTFEKAYSNNLPSVSANMVHEFYVSNLDYLSVEFRNVKTMQSARESYGDNAVGYVQLKRQDNKCTVKAKITPEHKIREKGYNVEAVINEKDEKMLSCKCLDCVASEGGCKHGFAFLFWLHRRSEEPSVTSTICYWKKSAMANIGNAKCDLQSLVNKQVPVLQYQTQQYSNEFVAALPQAKGGIFELNKMYQYSNISVYQNILTYKQTVPESDRTADHFIQFMSLQMTDEDCIIAEENTQGQSEIPLWFELKFGRITASRIYEAAKCKTTEGVLRESVMGASGNLDTEPIRRGKRLEPDVLKQIAKMKKLQINKAGLFLKKEYPLFGASPDGITDQLCIEVKCPTNETSIKRYVTNGIVQKKFFYQLQLQMFFSNRQNGLFCVASPNFEETHEVAIYEVNFCEEECLQIMDNATQYWKTSIYPALLNL